MRLTQIPFYPIFVDYTEIKFIKEMFIRAGTRGSSLDHVSEVK